MTFFILFLFFSYNVKDLKIERGISMIEKTKTKEERLEKLHGFFNGLALAVDKMTPLLSPEAQQVRNELIQAMEEVHQEITVNEIQLESEKGHVH